MNGRDSPGGYGGGGEQAQTLLIDHQNSQHRHRNHQGAWTTSNSGSSRVVHMNNGGGAGGGGSYISVAPPPMLRPLGSFSTSMQSLKSLNEGREYGSSGNHTASMTASSIRSVDSFYAGAGAAGIAVNTVRFQVVVWNIGTLDVVAGTVPMTFRISLFWNDISNNNSSGDLGAGGEEDDALTQDDNTINANTVHSMHVWKMHGRQRAFQQELKDMPSQAIEVPPLAIMNVSTFATIGSPDIEMLNEDTRLLRWTCMYRATVVQENLRVDQFPHDEHNIHLKLAILSGRGKGCTWDRRFWKLGLATAEDTQNSTRIPHGLVVDQARLPGFTYNKERGLEFEFCRLDHGIFDQHRPGESTDYCLKVSLNVLRESGYYDNNIVPILALMNVVAISVLTFDDTEFFYRALITLNIAFVQMGMRMTADNHLPNVEYEIRLQRILNEFFVVLMLLVLEAMFVYVLTTYYGVSGRWTKVVDWITGILAFLHNVRLTVHYYISKRRAKERLEKGVTPKEAKEV
jgi:hypothetical protein